MEHFKPLYSVVTSTLCCAQTGRSEGKTPAARWENTTFASHWEATGNPPSRASQSKFTRALFTRPYCTNNARSATPLFDTAAAGWLSSRCSFVAGATAVSSALQGAITRKHPAQSTSNILPLPSLSMSVEQVRDEGRRGLLA